MSEYTIREQAYYWLVQMEEKALSDEQDRQFKAWLNADIEHTIIFAEAELMWCMFDDDKVKAELKTVPLAQSQFNFIQWCKQTTSWFIRSRLVWGNAVTVVVCLLLVNQYYLSKSDVPSPQIAEITDTQSYHSQVAESRRVTLKDGSTVFLDANSSITVKYSASSRQVQLMTGSAYFDVTPAASRPFIVSTGALEIEVTGTKFDVQRKHNVVYVAVEHGSVNVSQPLPSWNEKTAVKDNQIWQRRDNDMLSKVSLTAGQEIKGHRLYGLGKVKNVAPELLASWRKGKLAYINRSLGEVVQDMNRYSPTQISISAEAKQLKLSGTFDSHNIPVMLNVIQTALPVTVDKKEDEFYITTALN